MFHFSSTYIHTAIPSPGWPDGNERVYVSHLLDISSGVFFVCCQPDRGVEGGRKGGEEEKQHCVAIVPPRPVNVPC